jgi:hypothetical protein
MTGEDRKTRRAERERDQAARRASVAAERQERAERVAAGERSRAELLAAEKSRAWAPLRRQSYPRRMDLPVFFRSIPGMAAQFDLVVPEAAVNALVGTIACACGTETQLPEPGDMRPCDADCGRWFLRTGGKVWRAFYPPPKDGRADQ